MDGRVLDAMFGAFFFVWLITWGFFCVAGALILSRHDKGTLGFVYAFFLGPLGVLMAFLKAENIDAAERDKKLLELVRHAILTREASAPISTAGSEASPTPRGRTYEQIIASEPPAKPRRFR